MTLASLVTRRISSGLSIEQETATKGCFLRIRVLETMMHPTRPDKPVASASVRAGDKE
jgi:hypothetical protein